MRKLIRNKHFISFVGLAIICTSLFLLFVSKDNSSAETNPNILLSSDKATPVSGTVKLSLMAPASTLTNAAKLRVENIQGATEFPMVYSTATQKYEYSWDTSSFSDGSYRLKALFYPQDTVSTYLYESNTIDLEVRNHVILDSNGNPITAAQTPATQTDTQTTATTTPPIKELEISFLTPSMDQQISGDNFEIKLHSSYEGTYVNLLIKNVQTGNSFSLSTTPYGLENKALWDIRNLANGKYLLKASARIDNLIANNEVYAYINNPVYTVQIIRPLNDTSVRSRVELRAKTTPANAGPLYFRVVGNAVNTDISANYSETTQDYLAYLDTTQLDNTSYYITANISHAGRVIQDGVTINVANIVPQTEQTNTASTTPTNTDQTNDTTQNTTTSPAPSTTSDTSTLPPTITPSIRFNAFNAVIYGSAAFSISTNIKPDSVTFQVFDANNALKETQSGVEVSTNQFRYTWPSTLPFGKYKISANAAFASGPKSQSISIEYRAKPTTTVQPQPAPTNNTNTGTIAPQPRTITPLAPRTTQTMQSAPIGANTTLAPAQTSNTTALHAACISENIKDPNACQAYLSLPLVCKERRILTRTECNSFTSLPLKCQEASITDPFGCQNYLQSLSLPRECQEAGISDQNECRLHIQKLNLPTVCVEANILDFNACQAHIAKEKNELLNTGKCEEIGIKSQENCRSFMEWTKINPECELVTKDPAECRTYLLNSFGMKICKEAGISDNGVCESFIFNSIRAESKCQNAAQWDCDSIINDNLGTLASTQTKYEQLEKSVQTSNKTTSIREINEKIGKFKNFLPLNNEDAKIKLVSAKKEIVVRDKLIQTSPVLVMIDSDSDGLADDMEKRIGTDAKDIDTDRDGFDDYTEYKNGYNPLGEGKINNFKPAPVDEAIMNDRIIEHPKATSTVDTRLVIKNLDHGNKTLSGQAAPGQVYSLYIYSDLPVMTTVQTDEFGNWQYVFQDSMIDGQHEVYLALNDNTGKIVNQSKSFNFFIKEAQAVSADEYVATSIIQKNDKSKDMLIFYLVVSGFAIFIGISTFFIYLKYYKKDIIQQ